MNKPIHPEMARALKGTVSQTAYENILHKRQGPAEPITPKNSWFNHLPKPPPGVIPNHGMAMDDNEQIIGIGAWAGNYYNYAFDEGLEFLGYPYLAQLAQRPEYRRIVEVIATEMTRKWIKIESTGGDAGSSEKINQINAELERLDVQKSFQKIAEQDGFFGRAHLYIDTGDTDNRDELKTPIGDGSDILSQSKITKGKIRALLPVEAVWTYPTNYNSSDPLKGSWYNPEMWFVMGKEVHVSRLLKFVGREVPDLLKPAYSFGGLSLTQMAKPYVDNWLQTRQAVNDIIQSFTVFVLKTDMMASLQGDGTSLARRAEIFNNYRNNRGLMMLDKDAEEFDNISAPLNSLDSLQAQSQEHMASVSGIPIIKLLGIQPSGLNASSEGEIRTFYDTIHDLQNSLFRANLTRVINFIQLNLFGAIDQSITFVFEPLWSMDEVEKANYNKIQSETDQINVEMGAIAPKEVRKRLATSPNSPYPGIDPDDLPEPPPEENDPKGGPGGTSDPSGGAETDSDTSFSAPPGEKDGLEEDSALDEGWNESKHPRPETPSPSNYSHSASQQNENSKPATTWKKNPHKAKIVGLKSNPKKPGSNAHNAYSKYKEGMSVQDYINAHGGDKAEAYLHLAHDLGKGFLQIVE